VGVRCEQRADDFGCHAFRIAEHIIVPEAQDAIAFEFDGARAILFGIFPVLTAVHLDNQASPVAGEIDDVIADWDLATKA
jgi:hypothetical protein